MKRIKKQQEAGFTLIEMIVVVAIVAILATIAAPNFLGMLSRQRLNSAQAEAMSAIREAQAKARQEKRPWQACFQDNGTQVRWFVSPLNNNQGDICNTLGVWNNLIGADSKIIQIDPSSSLENGFYRVSFKPNGWVDKPQIAPNQDVNKIIFKLRNQNSGSKRCVYVATLLGSIRTASNNDCQ